MADGRLTLRWHSVLEVIMAEGLASASKYGEMSDSCSGKENGDVEAMVVR